MRGSNPPRGPSTSKDGSAAESEAKDAGTDAAGPKGSAAEGEARATSTEEELRKQLREAQRELRNRTMQLLQSAQAHGDGDAERQRLKQMVRAAETRAEKIQKTLSFRLGYELIHRTKSLRGLASLPRALWEVNQEAGRRRNGKSALSMGRDRARRFVGDLRDSAFGKKPAPARAKAPSAAKRQVKHFELPASLAGLRSGKDLAKLRVACIMDEFTLSSFGPECDALLLSPDRWDEELREFKPQLLFVESAWRGKTDEWSGKIGHVSPELRGIVTWCRDRADIPTVFWCKEDPVHFSTFINTAALFDFVFTTDIDCIHRYKQLLGHDRVYLLPFACQPAAQNPIEKYERKDAACFAGAYYTRYPERQRDFLRMVLQLLEHRPVEIFDRNFGKSDPGYQFPESFRPLIVGTLAFSEIDRAYKGYDYAININSIKYSQSMYARRVFEVLASNTVTVSNFSRGIGLMFGDLVIATDDATELGNRLATLAASEPLRRKFRLLGLRKVLSEHTYQDRLAYMVSKVFEIPPPDLMPTISVVGYAESREQVEGLTRAFARQRYPKKRLVLIAPGIVCQGEHALDAEVTLRNLDAQGESETIASLAAGDDFVACFVPEDYYGETYLTDLALATRYVDAPVIGKAACYAWSDAGPVLVDEGSQYRPARALRARSAMARAVCFSHLRLQDYAQVASDLRLDAQEAFAIDEFSYCLDGEGHMDPSSLGAVQGEIPGLDLGIPVARLLAEAEAIQAIPAGAAERVIGPERLAEIFPSGRQDQVSITHTSEGMVIDSTLGFKMSEYVYTKGPKALYELGFSSEEGEFYLDASAGASANAVFIFLDSEKRRLASTISSSSTNHRVEVPAGASLVRFALLISGVGQVLIRRLVIGPHLEQDPPRIYGRSKTLVVTNHYPSPTDLYRNAFVHRRVLQYRAAGSAVDVFRLVPDTLLGYHDFEGVPVVSGGADALRRLLASNAYESVLVHFLDEEMWSALASHIDAMQVVVWVHGSEIQSWHRRRHNYESDADINNAKLAGERRMRFWRSVLEHPHPNLKLVFVSQHLADEVQEDMGITLPPAQLSVIHNLIDSDHFSYEAKPAEQRLRILSIRPFASRTYANDLTVKAILALSEKPFFDELEFRIIGDGILFEDTLEPLRRFRNVLIEKRFLTQEEIAELHKDYGVFLVPTRMDSQGVSRDEAMASGLVPVTSAVAAIPEFVDSECGFLVPAEDAAGLAAAIETLHGDPELFGRMSAAAAARVRRQSGPEQTIARELELFASSKGGRS